MLVGKGDNKDGKGKSYKGKGKGYSERLFLTHFFLLHLTGSQYHAMVARAMTRMVRLMTGMARGRVMMSMARRVTMRIARTAMSMARRVMTRMARVTMSMARRVMTRMARVMTRTRMAARATTRGREKMRMASGKSGIGKGESGKGGVAMTTMECDWSYFVMWFVT
jgi:hypothetical protein